MTPWTRTLDAMPPDSLVVETMIADENGVRNEAHLKRRLGLLFFADDSIYVYYTPTHWRY